MPTAELADWWTDLQEAAARGAQRDGENRPVASSGRARRERGSRRRAAPPSRLPVRRRRREPPAAAPRRRRRRCRAGCRRTSVSAATSAIPRAQVARAFEALATLPRRGWCCFSAVSHAPARAGRSSRISSTPWRAADAARRAEAAARLRRSERDAGRAAPRERWGPRLIDLDLLVYGEHAHRHTELTVPHPGIAERGFVLVPLAEICADPRGARASVAWRNLLQRLARRGCSGSTHDAGSPTRTRRRAVPTPHRYVVVEGPIGVGKTSLARRLGRELRRAAGARAGRRESVPRALLSQSAARSRSRRSCISCSSARSSCRPAPAGPVRQRARRRLPAGEGRPVRAPDARRRGVRAVPAGARPAGDRRAACRTSSSTCRRRSTCCSTASRAAASPTRARSTAATSTRLNEAYARFFHEYDAGAAADRECGRHRPDRQRGGLRRTAGADRRHAGRHYYNPLKSLLRPRGRSGVDVSRRLHHPCGLAQAAPCIPSCSCVIRPVRPSTLTTLGKMREDGRDDRLLTCYDASFAVLLDEADVDVVLVGDSLGMVIQGHDTTVPVTVDDVIYHTRAVSRGPVPAVPGGRPALHELYLDRAGADELGAPDAGRRRPDGQARRRRRAGATSSSSSPATTSRSARTWA